MIKSMTGFGRAEYNNKKRSIIVEMKAVNHRYSDVSVKMPRRYSFAEEGVKAIVRQSARRGKVDVSIIVESITEDDTKVRLNTMAAKQYYDNLTELKETFELKDDITLQMLASMPDVLKYVADVEDEAEFKSSLAIPVEEAVRRLNEMRSVEGKRLAEDIIQRGSMIEEMVKKIEKRSPRVTAEYTAHLKNRIQELLGNEAEIPQERILTEAALFADKCNVTEELVRLSSHIHQLKNIIVQSSQPVGKKLDFLVQEMNREANTIGSKSNDITITNLVLEIKSEIEKIREQVQNIE